MLTLIAAPPPLPLAETDAASVPFTIVLLDCASRRMSPAVAIVTPWLLSSFFSSTPVSELVTRTLSEPARERPEPVEAEAEAMMEISFSSLIALMFTSSVALSFAFAPMIALVTALSTVTSSVPPAATSPVAPAMLAEISSRSSLVFAVTSSLPSVVLISA